MRSLFKTGNTAMNPGWLVESASLWGFHGAMMARVDQPLRTQAVHEYWLRNRVRFDTWNQLLKEFEPWIGASLPASRSAGWKYAELLFEEILMSEPLARVCAAVATSLEERSVDGDSRSILHNVLNNQLDIRKRSLRWLLEGIDTGVAEAQRLNRLRGYLEHWTDMLLGFFAGPETRDAYAFCPERASDFAREYSYRNLGDRSESVWTLLIAGNRQWIAKHTAGEFIHPDLSRDVIQAALAMVHPVWFDSLGLLPSRAAQRLASGLHSVDRTIESLVDGSWDLQSSVLHGMPQAPSRRAGLN
jgi:hypothetical protein